MKSVSIPLAIVLSILLASCQEESKSVVGRYLYIDCMNTIHVRRECLSTQYGNEKTWRESIVEMRGVKRVDTSDLEISLEKCQFCPKCIDDVVYDEIVSMVDGRNKVSEAHRENNDMCYTGPIHNHSKFTFDLSKLRGIYDTMRNGGYKQSWEEFKGGMIGRDKYQVRKRIFDALKSNNDTSAKSYEEFVEGLRFVAPAKPKSKSEKCKRETKRNFLPAMYI